MREPRGRGTSAVRSHYQITTGEDSRLRGLSACCSELQCVCELALALQLRVVTSCVYKCLINPITNQNHTQTRDGKFTYGSFSDTVSSSENVGSNVGAIMNWKG
jgi:hypothetical protein